MMPQLSLFARYRAWRSFTAASVLLLMLSGCGSGESEPPSSAKRPAADTYVAGKADGSDVTANGVARQILASYGITQLQTYFPDDEVQAQQAQPASEVTFEMALRAAIDSFLYDAREMESPLFMLLDDPPAEGPCFSPSYSQMILCSMNQPSALLALVPLDGAVREVELDGLTRTIYPPEAGESSAESWIFYLQLPDFSGSLYWAVVHRVHVGTQGRVLVYNYGFN